MCIYKHIKEKYDRGLEFEGRVEGGYGRDWRKEKEMGK